MAIWAEHCRPGRAKAPTSRIWATHLGACEELDSPKDAAETDVLAASRSLASVHSSAEFKLTGPMNRGPTQEGLTVISRAPLTRELGGTTGHIT